MNSPLNLLLACGHPCNLLPDKFFLFSKNCWRERGNERHRQTGGFTIVTVCIWQSHTLQRRSGVWFFNVFSIIQGICYWIHMEMLLTFFSSGVFLQNFNLFIHKPLSSLETSMFSATIFFYQFVFRFLCFSSEVQKPSIKLNSLIKKVVLYNS